MITIFFSVNVQFISDPIKSHDLKSHLYSDDSKFVAPAQTPPPQLGDSIEWKRSLWDIEQNLSEEFLKR